MEWISVKTELPELQDSSVIGYFENGSIETIHIQDWFAPITNGIIDGVQQYTKWYLTASPTVTHWMPLPDKPKDF